MAEGGTSFVRAAGWGRRLAPVALIAIGLVLTALPLVARTPYAIGIAINAFAFIILAMSLNVIYGYAGLLSFAQVGFWGLGAYIAAIVAVGWNGAFWTGMALAICACAAVGALLAFTALRLSNHAFVIVSMAFTLLLQMLAQEWIALTNGPMGIPGLPVPSLGIGAWSIQLDSPQRYYYLALAVFVVSIAVLHLVLSSRIGRTLSLLRHDETLARSFGVRVTRWKVFASGFSAAFAAAAGATHVFFVSIVDPLIFDPYFTQIMLVTVIVGGLGSFWPVIAAGAALTILPELLRTPNEIRMIYYGVILIACIVLLPNGVAGLMARLRTAAPSRRARQDPENA
jgi:branched-chain amino acid transport system permease protein